ncbi:MAG: hypothetical protein ACRBFS_08015 [Aureispira sp.]
MKTIQKPLLVILFLFILFIQMCGDKQLRPTKPFSTEIPAPDTVRIVHIDTFYPAPQIVTIKAPIPTPEIIYRTSTGVTITDTLLLTESSRTAKVYTDTFNQKDIDLYYTAVVSDECELVRNQIDYQLKIPREIVKTQTTTITKPIPVAPTQLLLNCRVGTNWNGQTTLAPGLQLVTPKGWAIGYSYDLFTKQHHVTLAARLLQFN